MIIKVCDRCGETIESKKQGIYDQMTQAIPKIHYQIKKYYGVGVPGVVTEIPDEIHLCENCNNDLTAWLGDYKDERRDK